MAYLQKPIDRLKRIEPGYQSRQEKKNHFLLYLALTAVIFPFINPMVSLAASPIKEMSDTVEALCPKLAALNSSGLLSPAETDVFERCREVKIQAGESFDDLTEADRTALANMTSTQSSTMSRVTVEFAGPQVATVAGRLQALRAGSVGGLALNMDVPPREPALFAGPVTSMPDDTSTASTNIGNYGRLGLFINGSFGTGDRDRTDNEPGFDFDAYSLTAGMDYRLTDRLVLGAALGYADSEADIENNGGEVESDGYGASVYGSYYVGQLYFDVIGVYGRKDFTITRNVNYIIPAFGGGTTQVEQSFSGDPDADELGLSGGVGYSFNSGGLTVQPFANLGYLKTDIDAYTESLSGSNTNPGFGMALSVEEQEIESLISSVGARVSYAIPTSFAVLTPQLSIDWRHEFDNDGRFIQARFVNGTADVDNLILIPTDDPDRDFYGLGAGISAVFPRGFSAFAYYDTLLDLDNVTSHQFTLGARFEF